MAECRTEDTPERRIARCTAALAAGGLERSEHIEALRLRAGAYRAEARYASAIADYDAALRLDSRATLVRRERGLTYLSMKEYRAAIRDLDRAMRQQREDPEAWVILGDAYWAAKEFNSAAWSYQEAIDRGRDGVEIYTKLGASRASGRPGKEQVARAALDRAIELNPRHAPAYIYRAALSFAGGENARAIEDYDTALRHDAGSAEAYFGRGRAYHEAGEFGRAIADFGKAMTLGGVTIGALEHRARAFAVRGDDARAIADLKRTAQLGGIARVTNWQDHLAENGYFTGPFDGEFTRIVEMALLRCARDVLCWRKGGLP